MDIEANKAAVRRYIELWRNGDVTAADEILAENFVDHTQPALAVGPEPVKEAIRAFRTGFPEVDISVEHLIAEGDLVAFRFMMRGIHQGPFAGFAPTGREAVLTGADFVRLANGKLVELWSVQDTLSWGQQLGFKISR